MNNKFRHIARAGLTFILVALPIVAFAQVTPIEIIESGDIKEIIRSITNWGAGLASVVAVAYLVYGGFQYITGGEKGATAGKTIIVNAIIGLFVIALAILIVNAVTTAIG